MEVTKKFEEFVFAVDMNYQEIYDFYQAAIGALDSQSTYEVLPANGAPDDTLIIFNNIYALRLTPKAKEYLPGWIEEHLMGGMDADSYWGIEHAKEKDKD